MSAQEQEWFDPDPTPIHHYEIRFEDSDRMWPPGIVILVAILTLLYFVAVR